MPARRNGVIGMPSGLRPGRPALVADAPFVGRQSQLACLHAQLDHARAGTARMVLVEGPAGIGKSALVRRFLADIDPECAVLRASGEPTESELHFGVLTQLARHVATVMPHPLTALTGTAGERLLTSPLAAGAALVRLLSELQDHASAVLVVLDNAPWSDDPSLKALTFAFRRLHADRLLALVIARNGADERLPEGLRRVLTGDHGVGLRLAGLDAAAIDELVGSQLSPSSAQRLRDHTSGNPLYTRALLEELPAKVLEDADAPLPAPRSYAAAVLGRLATCTAQTRQLVDAASVLGLSCPLHVAARLAALDDPLPGLEHAVAAQVLQTRPTSGIPLITFVHPLVHASVYQDLGPVHRASLHARAATLVDEVAARLHHRLCAASAPDPRLADELAAFARRQALEGRWDTAGLHFIRAARLANTPSQLERWTVEAVEALLLAGQLDEATTLADGLSGTANPVAHTYLLGRLAVVGGHMAKARTLLTGAWHRCSRSTDPGLAARIAAQLAPVYVAQGRGADAAYWAGQALSLAPDRTGTDLIRYIHLVGLGISGAIDKALTLTAVLADPELASPAELDSLLGRGQLRCWADDLAGAQRDLIGVVASCQDRSVPFRLLAAGVLGQAEYRLGCWDDALSHFHQAISIDRHAGQAWLMPQIHALAALIPAARGQWELAATHLHAAQEQARLAENPVALMYAASAHAHLAAARGDPELVVTALRPLLALESQDGLYEPGILTWQNLLVEALVALGDYDQAERLLGPFETLAAARRRHSAMAAAARARGHLRAARRDLAGAAAAFRAGLQHAARVAMPFERAQLELAYGSFLRRNSRRTLATERLEAARATLLQLDARPFLECCDRELGACGGTTTVRREPDPTRLTAQELAVARLAIQGLTNRQIARTLIVSVKTIEYHLGHVYAKLGVSSRVQLATRFSNV